MDLAHFAAVSFAGKGSVESYHDVCVAVWIIFMTVCVTIGRCQLQVKRISVGWYGSSCHCSVFQEAGVLEMIAMFVVWLALFTTFGVVKGGGGGLHVIIVVVMRVRVFAAVSMVGWEYGCRRLFVTMV